MKQNENGPDDDQAIPGTLRSWLGVAMGMAGACALAAQAMLELSALEAPNAAYAAQPAPARGGAQACGAAPCPVRTIIEAKG